jgi:quinol monooxygenase YgiN
MSGPFVFIGTYGIKSGKLEETKKHLQEIVNLVETNEPRLIAFNMYLDEQGRKVSVVQVHPDAASMEFHMNLSAEHIRDAFDYLEGTESHQVYGTPSDTVIEKILEFVEPGVPMTVMPIHEVGFTRTDAR